MLEKGCLGSFRLKPCPNLEEKMQAGKELIVAPRRNRATKLGRDISFGSSIGFGFSGLGLREFGWKVLRVFGDIDTVDAPVAGGDGCRALEF